MKYSPRTLMIVVTLACVATALVVRSRQCAAHAANFRQGLLSLKELDQAEFCVTSGPAKIFIAKQMCKHQFVAAYERVTYFSFLPLILPDDAPLKVPYTCECGEALELNEKDGRFIEENFLQ
jgi:hypothetical protein